MGRSLKGSAIFVVLLGSALALSRPARATQVSFEVRQTLVQTVATPSSFVAPTGTLAVTVTEHFWVGAGYDMVQNHDAIFWRSDMRGQKPIALSAIRVGSWYRNGETRHGLTYAIGPLITYANLAISLDASPSAFDGLSSKTYFIDSGADMSIGYVGRRGRVEAFMSPAWSYGRLVSPAVGKDEHTSALVVRIGVAFALLIGR
jgi:hypothetical protein